LDQTVVLPTLLFSCLGFRDATAFEAVEQKEVYEYLETPTEGGRRRRLYAKPVQVWVTRPVIRRETVAR
jgi:hypothetical protein